MLDYVQAGQWTDVIETRSDSDISEYMLTTLELSGRAFAMRIQGDSMLPQFEEGDIVVVTCCSAGPWRLRGGEQRVRARNLQEYRIEG